MTGTPVSVAGRERDAGPIAATAAEVRALVAARIEGAAAVRRIGEITLLPHQSEAASRLEEILRVHGGALLADDPGLGKTYVALAIAARAGSALVIAPAALRAMWLESSHRAQVTIRFISVEALSRKPRLPGSVALLIVDEAHHLRNTNTRRWAHLVDSCAARQVLLLSATPVHNRASELQGQLALFLGERAALMSDAEIAALVVRRTRDAISAADRPPALDGPHWIEIEQPDESLLDQVLALPAPVPPSDGGIAGALLQWTLVRQWSSSRAALVGALRRQLARAIAMRESLSRGVHPSRRELDAWRCADGAMQLAFPELLSSEPVHEERDGLLDAVGAHERALAKMLDAVAAHADPDPSRAAAVAALRHRHPGATIVAFAERAETVERLWALLKHLPGAAMLTASGGRVAGGSISRRELLTRVAPRAQGAAPPPRAERVTLLLTTDLLSEGVNLQDAAVVVHLDLPWSPARMEQRVGRVRRLGSPHLVVSVYALRPPASSERLLDVERRLRDKLALAGRLIGITGTIMPGVGEDRPVSAPELWSSIHHRIRSWRGDPAASPATTALVACIATTERGALALIESPVAPPRLVALDDALQLRADPSSVARASELASGPQSRWQATIARDALRRIERSLERGQVAGSIGAGAIPTRLQRLLLASIDRALAALPRHERAALLPAATRARSIVHGVTGAGAERVLTAILQSPAGPAALLRALAAFADTTAARQPQCTHDRNEERVTALLVFIPRSSSPA